MPKLIEISIGSLTIHPILSTHLPHMHYVIGDHFNIHFIRDILVKGNNLRVIKDTKSSSNKYLLTEGFSIFALYALNSSYLDDIDTITVIDESEDKITLDDIENRFVSMISMINIDPISNELRRLILDTINSMDKNIKRGIFILPTKEIVRSNPGALATMVKNIDTDSIKTTIGEQTLAHYHDKYGRHLMPEKTTRKTKKAQQQQHNPTVKQKTQQPVIQQSANQQPVVKQSADPDQPVVEQPKSIQGELSI